MNAALTNPAGPLILSDRRTDSRHLSVLRVGRVVWDDRDQLCVVRNISSGGLMLECPHLPAIDQRLVVELRSDKQMTGVVRWSRDGTAGMQFDEEIDVARMLREERSALLRVRPRQPRFIRQGTVRLIGEGEPVLGHIIDISIGGLSCRTDEPLKKGEPVVVALDGVGVTNAELRWVRGDAAGIRLEKPLPWRQFQLWLDQAAPR